MAVLLERPSFVRDVIERIGWLGENASEDEIDSFVLGLELVRHRIAAFPEAGTPIRQDERSIVRMRLFPRPLPYLVYYGHERRKPIREVHLLRLFGAGQQRPDHVRDRSW